jgi:hypothetical protein
MTKTLVGFSSRLMFTFVALMMLQSACFAQSAGGTNATVPVQPATTGSQPTAAPAPADVLKELEAMKARIAELEAQVKTLKAQDSASSPVGATTAASTASSRAPNAGSNIAGTPAVGVAASTNMPAADPSSSVSSSATVQTPADAKAGISPPVPAANETPFSDWDWTWLNGNPRTKDIYWDSKFFTPEIRADINYVYDFNNPTDHSMGGSSELFRSNEVQLEQLGIGGDFHYDNVRARFMTQFGMYSVTTPRNDASPGNGQWDLADAYRYISEAYGGYHFDVLHGINVDAGIFMSYIGLFSYYNFDNWAYQPSYVSSNTPWFFNGVRVQIFPTKH